MTTNIVSSSNGDGTSTVSFLFNGTQYKSVVPSGSVGQFISTITNNSFSGDVSGMTVTPSVPASNNINVIAQPNSNTSLPSTQQLTLGAPVSSSIKPSPTTVNDTTTTVGHFIDGTTISAAQFLNPSFIQNVIANPENQTVLLFGLKTVAGFSDQVNALFQSNPSLATTWVSSLSQNQGLLSSLQAYIPSLTPATVQSTDTIFGVPKTYAIIGGVILLFLILK